MTTAAVTRVVEYFRPAHVPAIVAAMGMSYAVLLEPPPPDVDGFDICELHVPDRLQRAVPARVRSYVAGRHCAMRSLRDLDSGAADPPTPVPPGTGPLGAPMWPAGVVGSITHSAALAIAVVARGVAVRGLGIDCELVMSADAAEEVADRVVPEANRTAPFRREAATFDRAAFVSAVFSAKESVYKCLNPLTGAFFGFEAVTLESVDRAGGTMGFRVTRDLGPGAPEGLALTVRFHFESDHVVTALSLPPAALG